MEIRRTRLKIAAMAAAASVVFASTGCGQAEDEKAYLDEIKVESYVKLGEYKGLEVVQAPPEVTDEYRDSYINYMLSLNPEDGVKNGDTVNIDYVGTLDGVPFDGGTAAGQNLTLGSGRFIPGFEEGLIGAKVGDTVELNLTFPENYHEELAGKDVVFTVTVNSIMAAEPGELNDAYVQSLDNGCSNVAEYQQYVYDLLMEDATADYERAIENSLADILLENCEFIKEPPQAMVDGYKDILIENMTAEAEYYGMTLEQLMSLGYGMDEEAYMAEITSQAQRYAKQSIILQAVADKEGLQVTDEELEEELQKLAEVSPQYSTAEEVKEAVDDRRFRESLVAEKVMALLRENAAVSAE